jgi:hypothetical protein
VANKAISQEFYEIDDSEKEAQVYERIDFFFGLFVCSWDCLCLCLSLSMSLPSSVSVPFLCLCLLLCACVIVIVFVVGFACVFGVGAEAVVLFFSLDDDASSPTK